MRYENARNATKCAIFLGTALSAAAAPTYTYTRIDVPGLTGTVATDINNKGQITGYGTGAGGQTGFFDNAGNFTTISPTMLPVSFKPFAPSPLAFPGTTSLVGINSSGQIAVNARIPDVILTGEPGGFVLTAGSFRLLNNSPAQAVTLSGINDSAQIIGIGAAIQLPTSGIFGVPGSINQLFGASYPYNAFNAIDNSANIIGVDFHGNCYIDANPVSLFGDSVPKGTPILFPGAASTTALGMNDAGDVVGSYVDTANQTHAFLATTRPLFITVTIKVGLDNEDDDEGGALNLHKGGATNIAILASAGYDVTNLDPATATLGPAAIHIAKAAFFQDVNHDGKPDLILPFILRNSGIACNDTAFSVNGQTFSKQPFSGTQSLAAFKIESCRH